MPRLPCQRQQACKQERREIEREKQTWKVLSQLLAFAGSFSLLLPNRIVQVPGRRLRSGVCNNSLAKNSAGIAVVRRLPGRMKSALLTWALVATYFPFATPAPFTAANLLVLSTSGSTNAATTMVLREFDGFGNPVQAVNLTSACTLSGSASADGNLRGALTAHKCPGGATCAPPA